VGSAVATRFTHDGHRVRALVRNGAKLPAGESVPGDITDQGALALAARDVDLAVHCAAVVSDDLDLCQRINVQGTQNLIDALINARCRLLVHISTISVYDDAAGPDFDEESPLWSLPTNAYGFTKAEAERAVRRAGSRGLSAVVLRPGLVASMHPRSRWGPLAIARASASDGNILPFPEIPYVHVTNLVDAIVLAATTPVARGRAYNVIDGVAPTAEYLTAVYAAIGRPPPLIATDAPRPRFRAERIRSDLSWSPVDRWPAFISELRRAGRS